MLISVSDVSFIFNVHCAKFMRAMFLVRTDTRNANRISLTVSALSDNHNECIKSYIQIGDSVRFLSSLSNCKFAKLFAIVSFEQYL